MRRLEPPTLTLPSRRLLRGQQDDVDGQDDYASSVARCKQLWGGKRSSNAKRAAFDEIKAALTSMSAGRRCHYCEDSCADEIEHMKPKDLYPEVAFVWENYVYACGRCNGPKSNKFAVIDASGRQVEVTRRRNAPVTPPLAGSPALIDPRTEDPLSFFTLDLRDTFLFVPIVSDAIARVRASYTIDVLRLNERDYLVERRRGAYTTFMALLKMYTSVRDRTPHDTTTLDDLRAVMETCDHQSVWHSMVRQARAGAGPGRMRQQFAQARDFDTQPEIP